MNVTRDQRYESYLPAMVVSLFMVVAAGAVFLAYWNSTSEKGLWERTKQWVYENPITFGLIVLVAIAVIVLLVYAIYHWYAGGQTTSSY